MKQKKENIFSVEKLIGLSPASSALRFAFFSQSQSQSKYNSKPVKVNGKTNYICRHSSHLLKQGGFSGDKKVK